MPNEIKKKVRTIDGAAVAVLIALIALAIMLGVVPLNRQSQLNQARGATLVKELADFDGLDHNIARGKADLQATQNRLAEAESRLPSQGEMAQFMQELAHVADAAGLQVDAITPHPVLDTGGYKAMPVEIIGSGDFNTCYKFLQGLRHMKQLARLDDLVIQTSPDEKRSQSGADRMCTVRVSISTFMAR